MIRVSGKANLFKTIFKLVSVDTDDISAPPRITISEKGLKFNGLGMSRAMLLIVDFPPTAFTEFKCEKEQSFGIMAGRMAKIVSTAKKDDEVALIVDEENSTIGFEIKSKPPKEFKVEMVEASDNARPLPTIDYPVKLVVEPGKMDEVLKDIEVVSGERLKIRAFAKGVKLSGGKFQANDDAKGLYEQVFTGDGIQVLSAPENSVVEQQFNLKTTPLTTVFKNLIEAGVDAVQLEYGDGKIPMLLSLDYLGGQMTVMIAPWLNPNSTESDREIGAAAE